MKDTFFGGFARTYGVDRTWETMTLCYNNFGGLNNKKLRMVALHDKQLHTTPNFLHLVVGSGSQIGQNKRKQKSKKYIYFCDTREVLNNAKTFLAKAQ